ncbi:hypothetical protein DPMN_026355 [Dreissena polymorpha]|uniref:Uncharacterized protein n=1 Tax=Dreissena polymorpha TaxID=45954 RepID=A0A9D4REH1_DREPO|nr:hypothetical protein DPMN_026355 [Dreissena polymorpha]
MKRSRVRFLGIYGEDLKNALTVVMEPMTSRSLGGHHIRYATAIMHILNDKSCDRQTDDEKVICICRSLYFVAGATTI